LRKYIYILGILLFAANGWGATYYIRDGASNVEYNSTSCSYEGSWTGATDLEAVSSTLGADNVFDLCDCTYSGVELDADSILTVQANNQKWQNGQISGVGSINYTAQVTNRTTTIWDNVTFDGSGITGGNGQGLIITGTTSNVTVQSCTFQNFYVGYAYALAITATGGGTNLIDDNQFTNCLQGARLQNMASSATVSNNIATDCGKGIVLSGNVPNTTVIGNTITGWGWYSSLAFELQAEEPNGNFTVGQTVTGSSSGASATIVAQVDNGTSGTLYLKSQSGEFDNAETITDPITGSATTTDPQDDSCYDCSGYGIHLTQVYGNGIVLDDNDLSSPNGNCDGIEVSFNVSQTPSTSFTVKNNTVNITGNCGDTGIVTDLDAAQTGVVVEDNTVINARKSGFWIVGGTNGIWRRNKASVIEAAASSRKAGFVLYCYDLDNGRDIMSGNVFHNNVVDGAPNGFDLYGQNGTYYVGAVSIYNNLLINIYEVGIKFESYGSSSTVAKNNIVYLDDSDLDAQYVSAASANHQPSAGNINANGYYGGDGDDNWTWGATTDIDDLSEWQSASSQDTTNSFLSNPSLSGYCPDSPTDPGVDAGTPTGISGQTDYYENPIVNTIDIGACEWQALYYLRYCASNGDGTGQLCGEGAGYAWNNFHNAFDALSAGDKLHVNKGDTFTEDYDAYVDKDGTALNPITVTTYGSGARPILKLSTDRTTFITFNSCDYWHIEGIEFDANNKTNTQALVFAASVDPVNDFELNDCAIKNSTNYAVSLSNAAHENVVIDGCEFSGNTNNGVMFYGTGHQLKNSTFTNNGNMAIVYSGTAVIDNNTFVGDWGNNYVIKGWSVGNITSISVNNNTISTEGSSCPAYSTDCIDLDLSPNTVAPTVSVTNNTINICSGGYGDLGIVVTASETEGGTVNITDNSVVNSGEGGISVIYATSGEVARNYVENPGAVVDHVGNGYGLTINSQNFNVYGNIIKNPSVSGIHLRDASNIIANNTIIYTVDRRVGYDDYGIRVADAGTDSNTIINNIIWGDKMDYYVFVDADAGDGGANTFNHNLYYGMASPKWTSNSVDYTSISAWNGESAAEIIVSDEASANPSLDSNYCSDSSTDPSVDAGTPTGISGQTDYYGKEPWHTIDTGACEWWDSASSGVLFNGVTIK